MQGLADGYFVLPYTVGNYLARAGKTRRRPTTHSGVTAVTQEVEEPRQRLIERGQKGSSDAGLLPPQSSARS